MHRIVECLKDLLIFKAKLENSKKRKIRTLHRNLQLKCNQLLTTQKNHPQTQQNKQIYNQNSNADFSEEDILFINSSQENYHNLAQKIQTGRSKGDLL